MSRNRLTTECDCGLNVGLQQIQGPPMWFDEYATRIGLPEDHPYREEYRGLIVGMAKCSCGRKWAIWLNPHEHDWRAGEIRPDGCVYSGPFEKNSMLDTSYWDSFNDEP